MATVQKSLRIPERTINEIEEIAGESGKDFTSAANELMEEAIRMRRCPGIVITEGVKGKRARIAGSGIEVWEVIAVFRSLSKDFKRLGKAYHWLSEQQLRAALGYYEPYQQEIDALISENNDWTPEKIRKKHPFME